MIQDFKFAFRQLLKSPGFTAVAVLTLALAIGVNSAIFALINGVVLHPVVPERPNEVVNVFSARQNASHDYRQFSYNEYRELRENGEDVFADVAALEFAVAGIGRDHEMRRSFAFLTSENYFSLMGAKPYRGHCAANRIAHDLARIFAASRMKFRFRIIRVGPGSGAALRVKIEKQSIRRRPRQLTIS